MRYAIYFTPTADDPLTVTAARWLGRDAFSGAADERNIAFAEMTAEPRRYGFHATLKAPFELADGQSEAGLIEALADFAATHTAFSIPNVIVEALGPFFALVPAAPHAPLQDFAAGIVERFDRFRAPLSDSDIARRKPERLTESQRQNLARWGYPYVMEDFRFHMTLTGPIEPQDAPRIRDALNGQFSPFIDRPLPISGLALFTEQGRGEAFTVHTWLPLKQS